MSTLKEETIRIEGIKIQHAIDLQGGNKSAAAKRLGISRETLRQKLIKANKLRDKGNNDKG